MKSLLIAALMLFMPLLCSAGNVRKDSFQKTIDSINVDLATYDTLNPWQFDEGINDKILQLQDRLVNRLLRVLGDARILKYDLHSAFNTNVLSHTQSADNRVHFFSLDEKTGGSFRSCITILHTRNAENKVEATSLYGSDDFGSSAFYEVYLLDSAKSEYVALGAVRTCSTCEASFAVIVQADSTTSVEKLLSLDYRFDDANSFAYDPETRELTYAYTSRSDDPLFGNHVYTDESETFEVFRYYYNGTYTYTNGRFIITEECWHSEAIAE